MDENPEILGCLHCLQKIRPRRSEPVFRTCVCVCVCVCSLSVDLPDNICLRWLKKKPIVLPGNSLLKELEYSPMSMKNFYNDPNKL